MEGKFFVEGEPKEGSGSLYSHPFVVSKRLRKLNKAKEFERVKKEGRSRGDRLLTLKSAPNDLGFARWGMLVSRKVGSAVTRNTVRRRLREIVFGLPNLGGWDSIVIVHPAAASAPSQALARSLDHLIKRVGFSRPLQPLGLGVPPA